MVTRKVLFNFVDFNGGQENLPSAFPFYEEKEREELYLLSESERISKVAEDLGVEIDCGESCLVVADDNLLICDLTSGGESAAQFNEILSPFVISAIISALGEIDGEEGVVLSVPCDEGVMLSAMAVKLMGFPIDKIIIPYDDADGENVVGVDIDCEDTDEYIRDFYEDFDILLGEEDAKATLAGEIYTDGFGVNTVAVAAFGVAQSIQAVCRALSGKKRDLKSAIKWLDNNCAYTCLNFENSREPNGLDKKRMKELCNIINTVKVY